MISHDQILLYLCKTSDSQHRSRLRLRGGEAGLGCTTATASCYLNYIVLLALLLGSAIWQFAKYPNSHIFYQETTNRRCGLI